MTDSPTRSFAKTLSWRGLAVAATVGVVWLATGRPGLAAGVGLLEFAVKLVAYYAHERVWARIGFGLGIGPRSSREGGQA